MPLIPKNANDALVGEVLLACSDGSLTQQCQIFLQSTPYKLTITENLSETASHYRKDPAHLIIIDSGFGLDAIEAFLDDIRSTHRNQLFMVLFDDFDQKKIAWAIQQRIDQFMIAPYEETLFVQWVNKLVETKKLLRSFIHVQKRLDAYDDAIDQAFLIAKWSLDGTLTYINEDFCTQTGFSFEEIVGKKYDSLVSGSHNETAIRDIEGTLQQKATYKGRITAQRKDQSDFIFDMIAFPILDGSDNVLEYIAFMQDVTQLVQSGRAIIEERQEAERKINSIKDYYLEAFANELRNPVHTILNFSESVSQQLSALSMNDTSVWIDALDTVQYNAHNILALVESLLNISRIRSGQEELRVTTFDVKESVHTVLEKYKNIIDQNGVNIEISIGENSRIRSDQTKFQLMADALIANAIKYSNGEIRITFSISDGTFSFTVEDNGNGIENPKERLEMYESFDIVNMTQQSQGMGLGLYMTKILSDMMAVKLQLDRSVALEGAAVILSGPVNYDSLKKQ